MSRGEPLIRQWNLLKAMQAVHYGLSADDLATRLECSKRQVLRDLKILQELGFPVSFEERDFGKRYWKLSAHFIESDKLVFSLTELISVYLSQKLLAPLVGTQFGEGLASLLDKIKAMLSPRALRYFCDLDKTLLVKTPILCDYAAHDKTIRLLTRAIQDSLVVTLRYRSLSCSEPYDTGYCPYGLVFFDSDLYCIGLMDRYNEIRTLKLGRIVSAELTDTPFRRPQDFSLMTHTQDSFGIISDCGKLQKIRVRLSGWAAAMVRETQRHPSQTIVKDDGQAVTVQFELANTTELKRWVLSFGRRAQVLSPKTLVEEMQGEVKQMAAIYTPRKKSTKN